MKKGIYSITEYSKISSRVTVNLKKGKYLTVCFKISNRIVLRLLLPSLKCKQIALPQNIRLKTKEKRNAIFIDFLHLNQTRIPFRHPNQLQVIFHVMFYRVSSSTTSRQEVLYWQNVSDSLSKGHHQSVLILLKHTSHIIMSKFTLCSRKVVCEGCDV